LPFIKNEQTIYRRIEMKKKLNLMTLSVEEKKKVLGGGPKCSICRCRSTKNTAKTVEDFGSPDFN